MQFLNILRIIQTPTLASTVRVSGSMNQMKNRAPALKANASRAGLWKTTLSEVLELMAK